MLLMFNFFPVFIEVEPGTMVFDVAVFAGLPSILAESRRRGFGVVQRRPMTNLALNVFKLGRVDFTDKPSRLIPPGDVTREAFRVKSLVDLSQRIISLSVAGMLPGFMGFGMTGFAYRFRRKQFFLIILALG